MAQIKLNATLGLEGTLPAISGANLTTLNASNISSGTLNSARFSGGKIVQTKMEGNYNWSGDASTNSTTFVGFGNELTITPTSSSNALLFMMYISDLYVPNSRAIHVGIKDKTNSSWVSGSETRKGTFGIGNLGDGINFPMNITGIIESAGSGARTYQGYFRSNDSNTVYINNGGSNGFVRFCIMEVVKG